MWRRLRTRDFIWITLFTLVVVATTSAVQLIRGSRTDLETSHRRSQELAGTLIAVLDDQVRDQQVRDRQVRDRQVRDRSADWRGSPANHALVRRFLDAEVSSIADVVYVQVVDDLGEVVVGSGSAPPTSGAHLGVERLLALSWWRRLGQLSRAGEMFAVRVPFQVDGGAAGVIHVVMDTSLWRARQAEAVKGGLATLLVALACSWLVALFTMHVARRPLRRLSQQLDRLRFGDYDLATDPTWDIDVREFAEQLRVVGRQIRSDRLDLLGRQAGLEHILRHIQDAVLMFDADLSIRFANGAAIQLLGAATEDIIGDSLIDHVDQEHPLGRLALAASQGGDDLPDVAFHLPGQTRFRHAMASTFQVAHTQRERSLYVIVVVDLESIRTLKSLVEYGARMTSVGQIAAEVVHEVKNPLNSMNLHLELLRRRLADASIEDSTHSLDAMSSAIERINRLVRSFLDFVRPVELAVEELDLASLIGETLEFVRPEADSVGIAMTFEPQGEVRPYRGDPELLRQCLLNLVRNAIEAMQSGGRLSVTLLRTDKHHRIQLVDTGVGIPSENLKRVTTLYYTTKAEGSGVGLSVVQRVVGQHGGTLSIDSQPGRGTEVTIQLPLAGVGSAGTAAGTDGDGTDGDGTDADPEDGQPRGGGDGPGA